MNINYFYVNTYLIDPPLVLFAAFMAFHDTWAFNTNKMFHSELVISEI